MKHFFVILLLCLISYSAKSQSINYDSLYASYHLRYTTTPQAFKYGFVLPFDTSKIYGKIAPSGAIACKSGILYYSNGTKWLPVSSSGTYTASGYVKLLANSFYLDTTAGKAATQTMLNDSSKLKVKYSDSLTTFATPKNLKDTAAQIRTETVRLNTALIDTAALRVRYGDSLTVYATPKNLKDTAGQLRTTINAKQAQLSGTGFVKASGTTISYDNSTYITTVNIAAGTGISVAGSSPTYTITNSSPSSGGTITSLQVVSNAAAYSVTPNSAITSSGIYSKNLRGDI